MFTEAINHAPAMTMLLSGAELPGRPSLGAWLSYGLGSMNQNLPAYVVMTSRDKEASCGQLFYEHYWGSGFLPSDSRASSSAPQRPGPLPVQPARRQRRGPPRVARRPVEAERAEAEGDRRSGDQHAHRAVRDGLPDADESAGADRHQQGAEVGPRPVWPRRATARVVRSPLSTGPPAAGARRPLCPADARGVGPAQQPADAAESAVPRHRPGRRPRW